MPGRDAPAFCISGSCVSKRYSVSILYNKMTYRVHRDVPFDCIRKISCYPMKTCTQYSVPLLSDAQPMPTDLYELLSMLARWPDEFIQAFITEDGEVWPLAMFSPALLYETPLALSMSKAEPYVGDVCEK